MALIEPDINLAPLPFIDFTTLPDSVRVTVTPLRALPLSVIVPEIDDV